MNETIGIIGLVLLMGIIFFLLIRQGNKQLKSINIAVHNEAKIKGLQIKSIISPTFKEWKNAPFDKGKKTGSPDIEGKPYNKEFFRVVNCTDAKSNVEKTIWIRVTSTKAGALTLEWKDVSSSN